MRTERETQVDEDSGIIHARWQGRWMKMPADMAAETQGVRDISRRDVTERQDYGDNKIDAHMNEEGNGG